MINRKLILEVGKSQPDRRCALKIGALLGIITLGLAAIVVGVRAYSRAPLSPLNSPQPAQTGPPTARSTLHRRLSLQPSAERMRRRLGSRFTAPGKEVTNLIGTLTLDGQRHQVRVVRTQHETDGEQLSIALGAGPPSLTWDPDNGSQSSGRAAVGGEQALIERIVMDSPDHFVLAQLRGAGYYTVGQGVRLAGVDPGVGSASSWTVIRVSEAQTVRNKPISQSRLFCINETTGLIDKVSSDEQGGIVVADFSDWSRFGGEHTPRRIRWTRNNQTLMELELINIGHNPGR